MILLNLGMVGWWRQVFGWMFAAGFVLLVWDLLTIGGRETRRSFGHAELAAV